MRHLRLFENFQSNSDYWRDLVSTEWRDLPSDQIGLKNVFVDARRLAQEQDRLKEFDDTAAMFTPDEWYSIYDFTTGSGWQTISNIRKGTPIEGDGVTLASIEKLPEEPGVHYRGIGFDYRKAYDAALDQYGSGVVKAETIWSFSKDRTIGEFYRDTVPNGKGEFRGRKTKYGILFELDGVSGRRIDMFARKRSTWSLREVVYLPGTAFRVMSVDINGHRAVIKMEETDH